jgi:phosphoribosylamine-glycine ligase
MVCSSKPPKLLSDMSLIESVAGVELFYAGAALSQEQVVTSGGRVLAATATGETLALAVERAYAGVRAVDFEGMHYRKDIAGRALKRTEPL